MLVEVKSRYWSHKVRLESLNPQDRNSVQEFCQFSNSLNPELVLWGLSQKATYWVVKNDDGKILARVGARACPHLTRTGTMGFFAMDLSEQQAKPAALMVLETAQAWLQSQGVLEIYGPLDHMTWFNYRFSIPGKRDLPRHKWEPTTPPEYHQLFIKFGFIDFAYYHSVYFPYIKIGPFRIGESGLKKKYKYFQNQGFTMEAFDMTKLETEILPLIHEISHEVFQDSLMFEPLDYPTFAHLYSSALKLYDFSPSGFIKAPNGEIAGFLFAFYDGDYLVIKSIGIRKKFQGLKISAGAIYSAIRQSFPLGKIATISALVKTGLASDSVNKGIQKTLWFTWKHNYVLMKKTLSSL